MSPAKAKAGASPAPKSPDKKNHAARQSGLGNLQNPFEDVSKESVPENEATRVNLKSEEEQQDAARQREKKEAIERRDARRKSLANRRVSFAPEATLHTWDVIELAEDATSSSEATNSTRRASSASSLPASPFPQNQGNDTGSDASEPPSTPPHEEIQVAASPAHQRDLHQKKRRRSSGIPPMNFNNPEDFSSSPTGSVGSDDNSFITADEEEIVDASDSDSDKDIVEREETITNVDDITSQSILSRMSNAGNSNNTSQQLDDALRQATEHAGSQKFSQDEDGDASMEMATGEITYAFKPWVNKEPTKPNLARGFSSQQDQENVNPFDGAPNTQTQGADNEDTEMSMDVTQAVGGIIPNPAPHQSPKRGRRKSIVGNKRRSSVARRCSSLLQESEDETMELTTAVGGVQPSASLEKDHSSSANEDEDMSMEFTSVVGGVVNRAKEAATSGEDEDVLVHQQLQFEQERRASVNSEANDEGMDMTAVMGGILSPVTERTEPSEENTAAMDFTAAVGAILPEGLKTAGKSEAKALMEEEADHGQLTKSPFMRQNSQDMIKPTTPSQNSVKASENGSPSIVGAQTRSGRRSIGARQSTTPRSESRQTTPLKKPTTPCKQLTPQPKRPTTPSKTPPAKNVAMRKTSPKKLFKEQIKNQKTPEKSVQPTLRFNEDAMTGLSIPCIVLTPKRHSGVGIDQEGMGSPRVAALLDRRASIGDQAASFTPQGPVTGAVRFADPRELEQEIDHERAEDERRENGRDVLEREANGDGNQADGDLTSNLRDMIDSMTPKKNKLKGRKSLAVGAARGLLGKRPAELDEDDEEDATPKRLKDINRSPVKNVRLPAPPSKDETTGRLAKAPRFSLAPTSGNTVTPTTQSGSPAKATTPRDQGRFKDTEVVRSASKPPVSFNEQLAGAPAEPEPNEADDDRIHLQDFLNMTGIRFMELTTTKRRHTIAPNRSLDDDTLRIGEQPKEGDDRRLSACVVAGASTIPMLELYQHVSALQQCQLP